MKREVFVTMRIVLGEGSNELYTIGQIEKQICDAIMGVYHVRIVKFVRGQKLMDQPDGDYDD